jgi:hypothetical protein
VTRVGGWAPLLYAGLEGGLLLLCDTCRRVRSSLNSQCEGYLFPRLSAIRHGPEDRALLMSNQRKWLMHMYSTFKLPCYCLTIRIDEYHGCSKCHRGNLLLVTLHRSATEAGQLAVGHPSSKCHRGWATCCWSPFIKVPPRLGNLLLVTLHRRAFPVLNCH